MHQNNRRRRRASIPAGLLSAEEGWITLVGQGSGFDDCPLCRELASQPGGVEAIVGLRPESLPELARAGWLDDLLDLVGPNATVRVMGRDMEAEPVEEISMATFLARLGYN
ncbi:MAG: hypothetical protein KBF21_14885 [Thermoanaerobaculia bacterium]|jgi:hypothetical protein|nr:hypothetical protein [Thermoanaerobaculia bacterium]MBP9825509.1 hypothetical protein [Thermoanaerobaculia bacterium]